MPTPSPLAKAAQRQASLADALEFVQLAQICLDVRLSDLRSIDGWKPVVEALGMLETAVSALKFAMNG
jgi:hypothetical protein